MKHRIEPYENQENLGVDRNDPDAAVTAIEIRFPETFCERAWKVIRCLDDTIFLYAYKGRFVVTDESLYLTDHGNGSPTAPFGGPRWAGDSLDALEQWLLRIADIYDASDEEIPGWKREQKDAAPKEPTRLHTPWLENRSNVMVKMAPSGDFIAIRTYSRKHGGHGRFLVNRSTLQQIADDAVGSSAYEEDCGHYLKITRMERALQFSFTWISDHGDSHISGMWQAVAIPVQTIYSVLESEVPKRILYVPPPAAATIDARPAAATIRKIAKDRQIRRAFSKAMRDCFKWRGDRITLYRDGQYSFLFKTDSGYPAFGGLILHEGERHGYPYVYYSVHT